MNTADVGSLSFTYCSTGCTFHYSSQCCAWLIPFHPSCCWQTYFRCSCLVFNIYLEHGSVRSCCASLLLKKVNHDAVNVKCYWPLLSTHACWGIMKAPHCFSAASSSCDSQDRSCSMYASCHTLLKLSIIFLWNTVLQILVVVLMGGDGGNNNVVMFY